MFRRPEPRRPNLSQLLPARPAPRGGRRHPLPALVEPPAPGWGSVTRASPRRETPRGAPIRASGQAEARGTGRAPQVGAPLKKGGKRGRTPRRPVSLFVCGRPRPCARPGWGATQARARVPSFTWRPGGVRSGEWRGGGAVRPLPLAFPSGRTPTHTHTHRHTQALLPAGAGPECSRPASVIGNRWKGVAGAQRSLPSQSWLALGGCGRERERERGRKAGGGGRARGETAACAPAKRRAGMSWGRFAAGRRAGSRGWGRGRKLKPAAQAGRASGGVVAAGPRGVKAAAWPDATPRGRGVSARSRPCAGGLRARAGDAEGGRAPGCLRFRRWGLTVGG